MLIIDEEKEIKNFIKILYEINQIMKNIYCDETNFSPCYNIIINKNFCKAFYYNTDCLPVMFELTLDAKNFESISDEIKEINFQSNIDSSTAFQILKQKNNINKIQIDDHNIKLSLNEVVETGEDNNSSYIKDTDLTSYNLSIFEKISKAFIDKRKLFKDELLEIKEIKPEIINDILNSKDLKRYIVDAMKLTLVNEEDFNNYEDGSYLILFLNKKLLNGAYFKIKKLKKGDVLDYSSITLKVRETDRNDIYEVSLFVNTKFGIAEHIFMISDFNDIKN